AALTGGADVIQLRDKKASSRKFYEVGAEIRKITRERGAIFIVNDRVDIALTTDADGVHVGQDDLPAVETRKLIGSDKILGVSVTSPQEARQAERDGADYLGVGPVYEARSTKSDAGEPMGLSLIRDARKHCRIPIVGIGGINITNAVNVLKAGADGVAIISAIVSADDIEAATRNLKAAILAERTA
nr:thiamine phosphate synthase [Gammaproteobacteria bacterium]